MLIPGSSEEDRSEIVAIVERRKALHSRLDYMVQFLEMLRDTGKAFPEEKQRNILDQVKSTQSWQKQPQSSGELAKRIEDLDAFMTDAVSYFK